MTDTAKRCVEALRWSHYHDDCTDENDTCPVKDECFRCDSVLCNVRIAADLIESLSEQLAQVTKERDAEINDIEDCLHAKGEYDPECKMCNMQKPACNWECEKAKWKRRGVEANQ